MDPLPTPADRVVTPVVSSGPDTLAKPRILCLHGAGVNAKAFALQMRALLPPLSAHFRLVFVDGPYPSEMHPALAPVYVDMDPYACWGPWRAHHRPRDFALSLAELETRLTATMAADTGSGEWVGILGFSQGAKLAASILLENQLRRERNTTTTTTTPTHIGPADGTAAEGPFAGIWWRFGVILAGQALPYALHAVSHPDTYFLVPGGSQTDAERRAPGTTADFPARLRTPTLHVHGLQDPALKGHRQLYRDFCAPDAALLVEWDDGHRLPYKSWDVTAVVNGVFKVAKVSFTP